MTEATAERTAQDPSRTTTRAPSQLAQENATLDEKLAAQHARIDQLVDERLAELATLQESDLQIYASLETEYVFNAALDWVMLVTSAVAGALYLVEEPSQAVEQKTLRTVAQRGYWPEMDLDEPLPWPSDQDILALALKTGQTVQQTHVCQDQLLLPQRETDRSHLAVPIRHRSQPTIGVFALESAFADGFTDAQSDSATHLAEHAALAIQNALRHQQVNRRLQEALKVHQSSLTFMSRLDIKELPHTIVCSAIEHMRADRAALYRYDQAADAWSLAADQNQDTEHPAVANPLERSLVDTAAHAQSAQFARDPSGQDLAALPLSAARLPANVVPLDPPTPDILFLAFRTGSSFAPPDVETLYLYAGQAAMALKHGRQLAQVERAAQRRQDCTNDLIAESKAPLTAIQGYARLMLKQIGGTITGQQREFLDTILRNVSRLETLFSQHFDL